jgi:hypothetical protein
LSPAELPAAGVKLSPSWRSRLSAAGDFPKPWSRPPESLYVKTEIEDWVAKRRAMMTQVTPASGSSQEGEDAQKHPME